MVFFGVIENVGILGIIENVGIFWVTGIFHGRTYVYVYNAE